MQPSNRLKRVQYTPESQMRNPRKLFVLMAQDLILSRQLAWRLVVRDISAQYRQSFLGFFWIFIPPVMTAVGLTFAQSNGVVNLGETDIPYPAYVVFSMAIWQTFVDALTGPVVAVNAAKPMLAKIRFPPEAIIIAKLGEVFFNLIIKLILIVGLFLWFRVSVTWFIVLAPVALVHLILLGTAVGLWLAPLGVLYNDIQRVLLIVVIPWLLFTPVIYEMPKQQGSFSFLVQLNPVTPLLVTIRELATTGVLTEVSGFWLSSGLTIILLVTGWIVYRLSMPFIVERMSA